MQNGEGEDFAEMRGDRILQNDKGTAMRGLCKTTRRL
jgi:hypothetical protein